jgi:hypothetical protein
VNVTLSAGSGFSFKTQGGDILFNTNVNLTASKISQIKINGVAYTGKLSFTKIATRAGFTFVYDLANLNPHGVQSRDHNLVRYFGRHRQAVGARL